MGAVSAFTAGSYHCKPLMNHVIVIQKIKNKVKKRVALQPRSVTHQAYSPSVSTSKKGHLIQTFIQIMSKNWQEETSQSGDPLNDFNILVSCFYSICCYRFLYIFYFLLCL